MLRPPPSTTAASLFAHYELDAAFDEMFGPGHQPRDGYRLLFDRLLELPAAEWPRLDGGVPPRPGWVEFDPTNNGVAGTRHIRVAVGRD
jgi:hypothetical protein